MVLELVHGAGVAGDVLADLERDGCDQFGECGRLAADLLGSERGGVKYFVSYEEMDQDDDCVFRQSQGGEDGVGSGGGSGGRAQGQRGVGDGGLDEVLVSEERKVRGCMYSAETFFAIKLVAQ